MSIELERLEDRLALSPAVPGAADAVPAPAPALVTPAENEALLDPLRTRLGPKPEAAPLLAAAPASLPSRAAAPVEAPADRPVNFEDVPSDEADGLSLAAPPRPTEETSDLLMSESAELFGSASLDRQGT